MEDVDKMDYIECLPIVVNESEVIMSGLQRVSYIVTATKRFRGSLGSRKENVSWLPADTWVPMKVHYLQ